MPHSLFCQTNSGKNSNWLVCDWKRSNRHQKRHGVKGLLKTQGQHLITSTLILLLHWRQTGLSTWLMLISQVVMSAAHHSHRMVSHRMTLNPGKGGIFFWSLFYFTNPNPEIYTFIFNIFTKTTQPVNTTNRIIYGFDLCSSVCTLVCFFHLPIYLF